MILLTLTILFIAIILFIDGRIRSDLVALGALLTLLLFGILDVDEALSGFSNPVVLMMIGLFIVSGAILQTGLAHVIGTQLLKLGGKSETRLFIIIMIGTATIGAFISVLGTVALMLPIIVSMCSARNTSPRRFLIPLAYAGGLGGMLTLIGTPPNLVISEALHSAGGPRLTFFSFFPLGVISVICGTLIMLPLSKLFLKKKKKNSSKNQHKHQKTLTQLANEYQLTDNLFRIRVEKKSICKGVTVKSLQLPTKYGISILEMRRRKGSRHRFFNTSEQTLAVSDTQLHSNDILYVMGDIEKVKLFTQENRLTLLDRHQSEDAKEAHRLDFYNIGIAEIMLLPGSSLLQHTVKEMDFRNHYHLNVLGIQRKKQYILRHVGNEPVHLGDVLLIQGTWTNIARLSKEDSDWVVVGQPLRQAAKVPLNHKAPIAAIIMLLMVILMMFSCIPVAPVTAVLTAALLMILCGCFRSVEAAYTTINWESVVLIAAMMPMSLALEKTGASEILSSLLVNHLGNLGPYALMAGVYLTTAIITNFISNTATAVITAPIAIECATQLGCHPTPFLFAVTYGASMCFILPFSTPTNAIVMPIGHYSTTDYIKMGLPLQLSMGIIMIFVIPYFFPFY